MKKFIILLSLLIFFSCEEDKDETPPTVMITNIRAGAELSGIVKVIVDANDNDAIALVEFFVNGVLKGTSKSDEQIHTFNWDTDIGDNGNYQLYAKATDESDNVASTEIISVNVINYRTAYFFNTTLVPVAYKIDNKGDYEWIYSGDTAKVQVPKNTSIKFEGTTPSNWCGTRMTWSFDVDVPDTHVLWKFWVNSNYFFLYTINSYTEPIDYTKINVGLDGADWCFDDIPADGTEYKLGFYKAHLNSNIYWYLYNGRYWYVDGDTYKIDYMVPDASHADRNLYAKYKLESSSEANGRKVAEPYGEGNMGFPIRDNNSTIKGGYEKIEIGKRK